MSPRRSFSLGLNFAQLVCGAVIAIFVGYLFRVLSNDFMQYHSDAAYFFETASTHNFDFWLDESILLNENSLPILMYSWIYDAIRMIGIKIDPIWGILFNTLIVLISQLIVLLFARRFFGFEQKKLTGLAALLSLNGVLMMFAGIHMRDAFLLLTTTISVIVFRPRIYSSTADQLVSFAWLLGLMGISFLCRVEGLAMPLVIYLIALGVKALRLSRIIKVLLIALALVIFWTSIVSGVLDPIFTNYTAYKFLTQEESSDSSLANYLIYSLPPPISTLASALLVLFVKFPFWRGMMNDSYSLYVSLAAVQMLFVAPVFIVIILRSFFKDEGDNVRYLVLVVSVLLLMVAVTSGQVRHFAVVYPFLLLLYQMRRQIFGTSKILVQMQYLIFGLALLLSIIVGIK